MSVETSANEGFMRLLGDIDCSRSTIGRVSLPPRRELRWQKLPSSEGSQYDEEVRVAEDWEQPPPVLVQVLFQPDPDGIYDIQWLVEAGTTLAAGEAIARFYRTSDGLVFEQEAPFPLVVEEELVERNRRLVKGDPIVTAALPQLSLDLRFVQELVRQQAMTIAQTANAVIKGVMGALGESGQVTDEVEGIETRLHPERGYESLLEEIAEALPPPKLRHGDIVVVSEKVIAVAQGRVFPVQLLYDNDPKTTDRAGREDLAAAVREHVSDLDLDDLICADVLSEPSGLATAGVRNPNRVAHEIALRIHRRHGTTCDVVVSDTDTGLDVSETLIGCPSLGATPLGATAGLVLYECMRVANAGEFVRGSHRGIPLVISRPHARRVKRDGLGETRGYDGRLDASRERLLGFA
jgi:hypothetical protein